VYIVLEIKDNGEGNIDKVLNIYLKSNHYRNIWTGEDGDNSMKLLKVEIF
jgi:hypothetical protein